MIERGAEGLPRSRRACGQNPRPAWVRDDRVPVLGGLNRHVNRIGGGIRRQRRVCHAMIGAKQKPVPCSASFPATMRRRSRLHMHARRARICGDCGHDKSDRDSAWGPTQAGHSRIQRANLGLSRPALATWRSRLGKFKNGGAAPSRERFGTWLRTIWHC